MYKAYLLNIDLVSLKTELFILAIKKRKKEKKKKNEYYIQ